MKTSCILAPVACLFLLFATLHSAERSIAIVVKAGFDGEIAFAYRAKAAAKNIGWDTDVIYTEQQQLLQNRSYDFVICFTPECYEHPACNNYLAIFEPYNHFFQKDGTMDPAYYSFDGYLLTFSPELFPCKKDFLQGMKLPFMRWYPTVQKTQYQVVNPTDLFYICCFWGNRFHDSHIKQFLSMLDKAPYTCFYGKTLFQQHYPQSYRGAIPFDESSLLQLCSATGISLVLHSSLHNIAGIPSGRIFEAIAASSVVICDQNAFVKTHFGDAILYIDTNQPGPLIFQQVQKHINWIKANKKLALQKAKRAHAIFIKEFALENQLLQLEQFHIESLRIKNNRTLVIKHLYPAHALSCLSCYLNFNHDHSYL